MSPAIPTVRDVCPGSGFTLIELSIVLVIIGLIVGGVLTGQSLVHASQLRSAITDEQKYVTAVNTFRTKYNELPGDMVDATSLWGTDPNGCPDGNTITTPQVTTCNGNGNGMIENSGTGTQGTTQAFENFRAWQQLANAHLIPGAYSGTPGSGSVNDNVPGQNIPATKISNGGFEWASYIAGYASAWVAISTQYLILGGAYNTNGDLGAVLPPPDAQAIDLKMDDGLPTTGSVLGSNTADANGSCIQTYPTTTYNLQINSPYCYLMFAVKSW